MSERTSSQQRQLALDLGHRPAFGREDFLVAPGNQDAVDWIDRWPEWPGNVLGLFGPPGCGKSHLAQVFALRADAYVMSGRELAVEDVGALVAAHPGFVVEDADSCDARALLHLFNAVREAKGTLLLTGREPPARWPVALADLKSRLASIPAVCIATPDDAMMEAVLVKLFTDRQLVVGPDIIGYVVKRIDRSFAAARTLVATADRESLAGKRAITVPLIKTLIGDESV